MRWRQVMPEHDLDVADIRAIVQRMGRYGVPEQVAAAELGDVMETI